MNQGRKEIQYSGDTVLHEWEVPYGNTIRQYLFS